MKQTVASPQQPTTMALPLNHADAMHWFYKDPQGELQGKVSNEKHVLSM